MKTVRSVFTFNVREIRYPLRSDGKPALGFLVKAYPWLQYVFSACTWLSLSRNMVASTGSAAEASIGICVDTANLCTTLLRVLGVSAYTVLGVVETGDERFYGHAWTRAEANGVWYLLEMTIHKGRPPIIPLDKVEEKLRIRYVEVVRFNEHRVYVDREL